MKLTQYRYLGLMLVLVPVMFCGCKTAKLSDFDQDYFRKHVVSVHKTGVAKVPHGDSYGKDDLNRVTPGKFPGEWNDRYTNQVRELCQAIATNAPMGPNGKRQVIIFAHGGLNTEGTRLHRVKEIIGTNHASSLIRDHYPIFINWESGLVSSYGEHLFTVR